MSKIFYELYEARKVRDIINVIKHIKENFNISWVPVGGRENNLATINISSDPAAGQIERITNGIDAILERKWRELGKPQNIRSPREAVEEWFNIPEGRLTNFKKPKKYSDLSDNLKVTYYESDDPNRPTVDVRDYGCGIKSEDFKSSIVSLNESLKLNKHFLAGAFGQGGSTAFSFSEYAIIFSRAMKEDMSDEHYPVAVTIVRFNEGDPEIDKHGKYEYMVNRDNGNPLVFGIPEVDFPIGTLVRHIAMEVGKFNSILTSPTQGLYYLTHHYMFDPVFPFKIEEQRENSVYETTRTVAGNHRRLTYSNYTEYQNEAKITFRNGQVVIKWWVLSTEGNSPQNRIKNYTLASKPIIITFNGQKQGELPNTVIKKDLMLPYLERYIIVHVNCDDLDSKSRRELFSTTRETLRNTPILDDLRELVADTLAGDDKLEVLDKERKRSYLQRDTTTSLDNVRDRLHNRVKQVIKSSGNTGSNPGRRPPGSGGTGKDKEPIPVSDPPTFIEIEGSDPKEVYPGRRFIIKFKTDANPNYFMQVDSFMAIINSMSFGRYTGTTRVKNGYGVAYFEVDEEVEIGSTTEVTLEVRPHGYKTLSDTVNVKVVEPPKSGGSGNQSSTPNIEPHWISEGDDYWEHNGWDENTVAEVVSDEDSIDIFVSSDNKNLDKLIKKAQRRRGSVQKGISDFYLENVCFHAVLADLFHQSNQNGDNIDNEKYFKTEMKRLSETICGIIEEMFDIFAAEAASTDEEE